MRDPKPVAMLLVLLGLGIVVLFCWWLGVPTAARVVMLQRVATLEAAATFPPVSVWEQPGWLMAHRLGRLTGCVGLLGVVVVVSVSEGMAKRRRAVLGGFLLKLWTIGVIAGALSLCACVVVLVLPWPVVGWVMPVGLAGLVGLAAFALAAGRPMIP